jgi:hypothetical protein
MILIVFVYSGKLCEFTVPVPGAGSATGKAACAQAASPPATYTVPLGTNGAQGPPGPIENSSGPSRVKGTQGPPGPAGANGAKAAAAAVGVSNVTQRLSVPDFIGNWSISGSTKGLPLSATIIFQPNSMYAISGILNNSPDQPFSDLGTYKFKPGLVLLSSRNGANSLYYLANIQKDSFSASNQNTGEFYFYIRR